MTESVASSEPGIGTEVMVWTTFRNTSELSTILAISDSKHGRNAKLAAPYNERMGPFSLETLIRDGKVSSRGIDAYTLERWNRDEADVVAKSRKTSSHGAPDVESAKQLIGLVGDEPLTPQIAGEAFKARAKTLHPDAGGTTAEMQELNEANDVLKRALRDQKLKSEIWGKGE
jgi:hypothetical protein